MPERIRELIKNILILLLSLSVAVLALLAYSGNSRSGTEILDKFAQRLGSFFRQEHYRIEYRDERGSAQTATLPIQISVKNSYGRQSFLRDETALGTAYNALGGLLGEALESAGAEAEPLTQAQWEQALQQQGVSFRYAGALPAGLLADWLDVKTDMTDSANLFVLSLEETRVSLCCQTEDGFIRISTALDPAQLSGALEDYRPDGSTLACETTDEAFSRLDAATLLTMGGAVRIPAASASNPLDSALGARLATSFGFNPYGNTYTASDGSTVYEETTRSLTISSGGLVQLRNSDTENALFLASSNSDAALAEYAQSLLQTLLSSCLGEAHLELTGLSRSGGTVTLSFGYFLNGIPVRMTGQANAAVLSFSGRALTSLSLQLRSYSTSDSTLTLLPERQAAAIVEPGSLLTLYYRDSGAQSLSADWYGE